MLIFCVPEQFPWPAGLCIPLTVHFSLELSDVWFSGGMKYQFQQFEYYVGLWILLHSY